MSIVENSYGIIDKKYTAALEKYREIFATVFKKVLPEVKKRAEKARGKKVTLSDEEFTSLFYAPTAYYLMRYYTPDEIGQLCEMLKEALTTLDKLSSLRTNASLPYIKQISEDNIIEEAKKLTKLDMAKYYRQKALIPYCISKKRDLHDSIPFRKGYYVGDVFNTMPNGIGTYHSDKGEIIFGQWKDGKEHGAILHTKKTNIKPVWEAWQDGRKEKNAKVTVSQDKIGNEQALVFLYDNNQPYGWGTKETKNITETGYFESTLVMGEKIKEDNVILKSDDFSIGGYMGKMTTTNKGNTSVIEGLNGILGTLGPNNHRYEISENGDTLSHYYGEMDMRNLNGYGTYTSKEKQLTGYFYEGQLINGRKILNDNNVLMEGDFNEDGRLEGEGKIRANGNLYEGNFKDGNLNGKGKVTYKEKDGNNAVAEGIFDNGILINGTITKEGSDLKMLIKEKSNNPLSPNSKPIHPNFILKY